MPATSAGDGVGTSNDQTARRRAWCNWITLGHLPHTGTPTPPPPSPTVPVFSHIVVCVMENCAYSLASAQAAGGSTANYIKGNTNAPYINNTLIPAGALFTTYRADTHPSFPNYIILHSGANQGITTDTFVTGLSAKTIASELLAAGKTFKGYAESMPSDGYTGSSFTNTSSTGDKGQFLARHCPWIAFSQTAGATYNLVYENHWPAKVSPSAPNWSSLPTFSYVIPNADNDMHNSTNSVTGLSQNAVAVGDTWLSNNLASYVTWAQNAANNALFVLLWDESNSDTDTTNQVVMLMISGHVKPGTYAEGFSATPPVTASTLRHESLLKTFLSAYSLADIGNTASYTPFLDCWQ